MIETIDLYPTLCDLTGLPKPDGIHGASLLPLLKDPSAPGHPAVAYRGGNETIRTDCYRLIRHSRKGKVSHIELYDHESKAGETKNIADEHSDLTADLIKQLDAKLN